MQTGKRKNRPPGAELVPGLLEVDDDSFVHIQDAIRNPEHRQLALRQARKRLAALNEDRTMLRRVIGILENPNSDPNDFVPAPPDDE